MRFGTRTQRLSRSTAFTIESLEQRSLLAADLMYEALSVAGNVLPGGSVQVNSTIDNTGDVATSAPFDVQFYLSSDATFSGGSDTLLGTFTYNGAPIPARANNVNGVAGFPFTVTIPGGTMQGNWFIIARADSGNAYPEANESDNDLAAPFFVGNTAPTIGGVSVSPATVGSHGVWTLTATGVVDSDTIQSPADSGVTVQFWFDDGDGVFSSAGDRLLGSGVKSGTTFAYTGAVPSGIALGDGHIFAVASDGIDTTPVSADVTVVSAAIPTVGSVLGPALARRGRQITLTATGLTGTSPTVTFYRDSNASGSYEEGVDEAIGTGTSAGPTSASIQFAIDPAWGPLAQKFFAVPVDSLAQPGAAASTTVTLLVNTQPRVTGGVVSSVVTASKGSQLTLTARNVTDDDGPERVEFYRERSGNSALNIGSDQLIGVGVRSGNNWVLTLTVPAGFSLGSNRFYASAVDIVGARSPVRTTTVGITPNTKPVIAAFDINKNTVARGGLVSLKAMGVTDNGSIARVDFFFDSNNNGRFDPAQDRLITTAVRLGSSNNWRKQFRVPNDLPTGTGRFLAVAFDNLGVRSLAKSDTVSIT